MTRRIFLDYILGLSPAMVFIGPFKALADESQKTRFVLVRHFRNTDGKPFDHRLFGEQLNQLTQTSLISNVHKSMKQSGQIISVERRNFVNSVQIIISFRQEQDIAFYKNAISQLAKLDDKIKNNMIMVSASQLISDTVIKLS